jgi:hypothetical protein
MRDNLLRLAIKQRFHARNCDGTTGNSVSAGRNFRNGR